MRSLQTWRFCDSRVGQTRLIHVESVIIERCQAAYNSALSGTECVQPESSRGSGGVAGSGEVHRAGGSESALSRQDWEEEEEEVRKSQPRNY